MQPAIVQGWRRESSHGLEDATQTYVMDDFVTLDETSGEVRLLDVLNDTRILGLAQAAASGTTGTAAVASLIEPDSEIALDTVDYSRGSLTPEDAENFIPGNIYQLVGTSAGWGADVGNNGYGIECLVFERVEGDLRDQINGETLYRGRFRVLSDHLVFSVGPPELV